MKSIALTLLTCSAMANCFAEKPSKPNIVIYFADDISARELPLYGSSKWSDLMGKNTSDPALRANMPVLDKLANDGAWIKTAWAATVCNPSRAMMMSGRYAYQTKWWHNGDKGLGHDENNKIATWPIYMSSPLLLAHVAKNAGYDSIWSGKTQMEGNEKLHGFDEGCFTPGKYAAKDNKFTDHRHDYAQINGKKTLVNADTGEACTSYLQNSWNWAPHVELMDHPQIENGEHKTWWPIKEKDIEEFGISTYGADVELDFCLEFMERKHKEGKPFLIYHTTHMGHDSFNWIDPEAKTWPKSKWVNTPKVTWDGEKYTRTTPNITGDKGVYDAHGTITSTGQHHHLNYIDYQIWCYQQKMKELGIENDTVFIFAADNGTSGYGKGSGETQKGCHIPLVIYMPGMEKKGEQDILVSLADILPTVADLTGFEMPADYKLDGKSLVPYLYGETDEHHDWIYSYRGPDRMIRGQFVMKDGFGKWYDVTKTPADLDSFTEIKDWGKYPETHLAERKKLTEILPTFDLYFSEYNEPGIPTTVSKKKSSYVRKSGDDMR